MQAGFPIVFTSILPERRHVFTNPDISVEPIRVDQALKHSVETKRSGFGFVWTESCRFV